MLFSPILSAILRQDISLLSHLFNVEGAKSRDYWNLKTVHLHKEKILYGAKKMSQLKIIIAKTRFELKYFICNNYCDKILIIIFEQKELLDRQF